MPNKFVVSCANDNIWNYLELIQFLSGAQNEDITLYFVPEAIDLSLLGLYDLLDCFNFRSVNIVTHNPFDNSSKYNILIKKQNEFLEEKIVVSDELHGWNGKKTFLTCYGRPTACRLGIAAYLDFHYPDLSLIHFSGGASPDNINLYEIDKLANFRLESVRESTFLIPKIPLLYNSNTNYSFKHYNFNDPITDCYKDIFVDMVSETHVLGDTFFPTEKTTRPMWLKKPFIIFASKDYLCYLRQLGFRTFSDFWDEDYDGYEGKERYLRILQLIDSISKKSKSELNNMYWSMRYTLDYNYSLLQTQSYNVNNIEKII